MGSGGEAARLLNFLITFINTMQKKAETHTRKWIMMKNGKIVAVGNPHSVIIEENIASICKPFSLMWPANLEPFWSVPPREHRKMNIQDNDHFSGLRCGKNISLYSAYLPEKTG